MEGREEEAFDEARAFELCGWMSCTAVPMRATLRPGKHDITMDGHPPFPCSPGPVHMQQLLVHDRSTV